MDEKLLKTSRNPRGWGTWCLLEGGSNASTGVGATISSVKKRWAIFSHVIVVQQHLANWHLANFFVNTQFQRHLNSSGLCCTIYMVVLGGRRKDHLLARVGDHRHHQEPLPGSLETPAPHRSLPQWQLTLSHTTLHFPPTGAFYSTHFLEHDFH